MFKYVIIGLILALAVAYLLPLIIRSGRVTAKEVSKAFDETEQLHQVKDEVQVENTGPECPGSCLCAEGMVGHKCKKDLM